MLDTSALNAFFSSDGCDVGKWQRRVGFFNGLGEHGPRFLLSLMQAFQGQAHRALPVFDANLPEHRNEVRYRIAFLLSAL